MNTRTFPKSLHTVSVLVSMAHYLIASNTAAGRTITPAAAVCAAANILGMNHLADVHGLKGQAVRKMGGTV